MLLTRGIASSSLWLLGVLCCTPGARAESSGTTLAVSASILSNHNCTFSTRALTLDFGAIDVLSTVDRPATATAAFVCKGGGTSIASYYVSIDDGSHPSAPGARRMQHTSGTLDFLPYSLSWTPMGGTVAKNVTQTVTISGSVAVSDFQVARPGAYADAVILTVSP